MMNSTISIYGQEINVKEYQGQRVVTFKDIDVVHQRPYGTTSRNFRANRQRFISGEDFFRLTKQEIQIDEIRLSGNANNNGITLITESGYLMLVKSFTDDLAWKVQRQLVNCYFRMQKEHDTFQQAREKESQRTHTVDDYLRAASLVASCRNERLPYVLGFIRESGLKIPEVEETVHKGLSGSDKDLELAAETAKLINEAINEYCLSASRIAKLVGLNTTQITRIRTGKSIPTVRRARIICEAIRQEVPEIE